MCCCEEVGCWRSKELPLCWKSPPPHVRCCLRHRHDGGSGSRARHSKRRQQSHTHVRDIASSRHLSRGEATAHKTPSLTAACLTFSHHHASCTRREHERTAVAATIRGRQPVFRTAFAQINRLATATHTKHQQPQASQSQPTLTITAIPVFHLIQTNRAESPLPIQHFRALVFTSSREFSKLAIAQDECLPPSTVPVFVLADTASTVSISPAPNMASSTTPPFSMSKAFVEPTRDCAAMPADVVAQAERIVSKRIAQQPRRSSENPDPVDWTTLAHVLNFKARKAEELIEYRKAYLNDDAVDRFLQAVCGAVNKKAGRIRAIVFSSLFWTGPAQRWQKGEISLEKMAEDFWRNLRRNGVQTRQELAELEVVFFPRCKNYHWTLSVVQPQSKTFATLNSALEDAPYTRFLDHFVRPFLGAMLGSLYEPTAWRDASDTAHPAESSQQRNRTDCGAALCISAVAIAVGMTPSCGWLGDMKALRRAIAGTVALGGFVDGLWEL